MRQQRTCHQSANQSASNVQNRQHPENDKTTTTTTTTTTNFLSITCCALKGKAQLVGLSHAERFVLGREFGG